MPPTFTPPATDRCPTDYIGGNDRYYPASQPLRKLLGRYRGELRAPNVYKLTAAGQAMYDGDLYINDGPTGKGQPYDNPPGSLIDTVYYGSHTYEVSAAEAALLNAAGYPTT
jgi:hypothetical protein